MLITKILRAHVQRLRRRQIKWAGIQIFESHFVCPSVAKWTVALNTHFSTFQCCGKWCAILSRNKFKFQSRPGPLANTSDRYVINRPRFCIIKADHRRSNCQSNRVGLLSIGPPVTVNALVPKSFALDWTRNSYGAPSGATCLPFFLRGRRRELHATQKLSCILSPTYRTVVTCCVCMRAAEVLRFRLHG